jgi:hypothetical protein
MPGFPRILLIVGLLALSFGLGHGLGRSRPAETPTRAVRGFALPAGLASDLQTALLQPDLLDRAGSVARILEPLGPDALDEVQAAYRSVVIDTGDVELILLADWWARFDPAAAYDWAHDSGIGWHPAVLTAAVRGWARQDPEAAGEKIRLSIQDGRLMTAAIIGLVRGWQESGRDGLEAHLAELPAGAPRGLDMLARTQVARAGPDQAMAWAQGLPDHDPKHASLKSEAIERVVEAIADADPQAAASWVEQLRDEAAEGQSLPIVLRLTMRWAREDGEAAMRWLSTLAPAADIPTAVQETFRTWYLHDRQAATDWIVAAKLEPWLDPALATFAQQQSTKHPDEAVEWANRVSDPTARERALVKVGISYWVAAPEQAEAWLARTQLPDEVRAKIDRYRNQHAGDGRSAPAAAPSTGETVSP